MLPDLLNQIPADMPVEIVSGDGAYETKQGYAVIATRDAQPSLPPREGAMPWPERTSSAGWHNVAIAQSGRPDWKKCSGYDWRPPVENLMHRLKTLTGNRLWTRRIDSQATEVAIRLGVLNRMTALARPQSVRIA